MHLPLFHLPKQQVKEPLMTDAKPTPYAWTVTGTAQIFFGPDAQYDAENLANCCGVNARAFPLFEKPVVSELQGWKTVPVEPTQEMLRAATEHSSVSGGMASGKSYYKAMISSAPAMPSRQPLTVEQIKDLYGEDDNFAITEPYVIAFARAVERTHNIT